MAGSSRRLERWLPHVSLWWKAARPTLARLNSHRTALVAAGCAFYATLALFPGISMLISIYGLVFNPRSMVSQLGLLKDLLPPEAHTLITRWVFTLISYRRRTLGLGLGVGALVTFWSAMVATTSMLAALNLAYDETERRGFFRFQLTSFAMTVAAMLGATLALALLVALPAALRFIGISRATTGFIHNVSLVVMMAYVAATFAALYRFGPSRRPGRHHRILAGTITATVLWLLASLLFSYYVRRIASFDVTYGPLGAVAAVMLWFWFSVYSVLAGAELNSALELRAGAGEDASE